MPEPTHESTVAFLRLYLVFENVKLQMKMIELDDSPVFLLIFFYLLICVLFYDFFSLFFNDKPNERLAIRPTGHFSQRTRHFVFLRSRSCSLKG